MIPIRDDRNSRHVPYVTLTIIALCVIIYFWDRKMNPLGYSSTFADLGMRPGDVVRAVRGRTDGLPLVTLFTSMFLHGNLTHLLGNMLYLLTFGLGVEWALGGWRYALYYLAWGIVASAAHIFVDPQSTIPTVGASGAIGGVLGAYFLIFPGNKIEILIPFVPTPLEVAAWILLGTWFLYQILLPQEGVANWAHVGGFLAGMLTVLVMGGRAKVLGGRDPEEEEIAFE